MSKIEKLLTRLRSKPADFTWSEAIRVLRYFGYEEIRMGKTSGSRRKFINGDDVIILHQPHPSTVLKTYQINLIINKIDF